MPATDAANHKFIELKPLWVGKVGASGVASVGATTIPAASAVGLTNGNVYVVTTNRVNATGTTKYPANQRETFIGKLSGSDFTNCIREVEGTAQAWEADTVLEILVTATGWNKMIEGIEVEHNQDGTHKKVTGLTNNSPIEQKNAAGTSKYLIGRNASDQTILYDANNNELMLFDSAASAVNYIKLTNSATGNQVVIEAVGDDANIVLELRGKGTKGVRIQDLVPKVTPLTDGANIATNAVSGNYFTITIAGNRTMDIPTNPTDGQIITYEIKQDATGSRTITWASAAGGFSFGSGSTPILSTTANKVDLASFRYSATVGKWLFLGFKTGY